MVAIRAFRADRIAAIEDCDTGVLSAKPTGYNCSERVSYDGAAGGAGAGASLLDAIINGDHLLELVEGGEELDAILLGAAELDDATVGADELEEPNGVHCLLDELEEPNWGADELEEPNGDHELLDDPI